MKQVIRLLVGLFFIPVGGVMTLNGYPILGGVIYIIGAVSMSFFGHYFVRFEDDA